MLYAKMRPNGTPAQTPVYPTCDRGIRAQRVRELQTLTTAEYHHLLVIIKAISSWKLRDDHWLLLLEGLLSVGIGIMSV